jgi:tetratricopeptide (TPR) repeat protein
VASLFRNLFQSKTPAAAAGSEVDEILGEATRAYQAKDFARAVPLYERVIALQPDHAEAHYKRGNALKDLGQLPAALASYDAAVEHKPDFSYAWCNRGVVQQALALYGPALESFDRAIELDPTDAVAHSNRASLLQGLSRWQEALASYDHVLALNPQSLPTWFARGNVLRELQQPEAALACYREAVKLDPDFVAAHANLAALLHESGRFDAALASYDRAIALQPDHARTLCARAGALLEVGRLEPALASFEQAITLQPNFPEAQYNRSLALLLAGDFARGWSSHEWRWQNMARLRMGERRPFRQPLWLGNEPIAGKRLLLYSEQGLGDTVQFCRFAKTLADRGATVILEVHSTLVDLLETGLEGASRVVADDGSPLPEFDYQCPLLSLPLALKTTLDTIPGAAGYLRGDPARTAQWQERLGARSRPRVGLTWSGNSKHSNDRNRSFPLAALIEHLPRELDYVCMQKDIRSADAQTLAANPWIARVERELHDFGAAAALCDNVDLVISVDTSIAHLGGALGRPTWVLLPFNPDWRWLVGRADSPWYDSVRLYRQHAIGAWNGVFTRVAADLRKTFTTAG